MASFSGFRIKNTQMKRLLLSFQFDINSLFQLKDFDTSLHSKFKFKYVHKFPKYEKERNFRLENYQIKAVSRRNKTE